MADLPIIFSAPMVRALLDGRKTQTRRVIKVAPAEATSAGTTYSSATGASNIWTWLSGDPMDCETWGALDDFSLPYKTGDSLYVREAHAFDGPIVRYYATDHVHELRKKRPSIHMPRWASRITLTVTDVRVQRLNDISEADAQAEGAPAIGADEAPDEDERSHRWGFINLWNSLHGPGAWEANPWVAAYTFTVARRNIDQQGAR